jgi:hypothetical protein
LKQKITSFKKGKFPIYICYKNQSAQAQIELGPEWRVWPGDDLLSSLADIIGEDKIQVFY